MSNIRLFKKLLIKLKSIISNIVLVFLYRAIKVLAKEDSNIRKEFESWENGLSVALKCSINGPSLYLIKNGNKLSKVKKLESADIIITFKSLDAAFLVLTGQIGISRAYSEHRFMLTGDISKTMSLVRAIDITEAYLFPSIMSKRILKALPKKERSSLTIYRKVIFGVWYVFWIF